MEVGRRRRALADVVSRGVQSSDQCARALRRRLRGDDQAIITLDEAVGSAEEPARLAAGLKELAKRVRALREGQPEEALAYQVTLGFTDRYATGLVAAADALLAAEHEARVAVMKAVTQESLDTQDGRVLHLMDCVWRAFKDAAPFVRSLPLPPLGTVEAVLSPSRGASTKSDDEPADPTPVPAPIRALPS